MATDKKSTRYRLLLRINSFLSVCVVFDFRLQCISPLFCCRLSKCSCFGSVTIVIVMVYFVVFFCGGYIVPSTQSFRIQGTRRLSMMRWSVCCRRWKLMIRRKNALLWCGYCSGYYFPSFPILQSQPHFITYGI